MSMIFSRRLPDEVTITVLQDSRRPTAIIVSPIGSPQVDLGSAFQLFGVATDEVSLTQLDLWVDNHAYTYVSSPSPYVQAQIPFAFSWFALTPGAHTLFVRAYDNQGQTTDSSPLKVQVVDNHAPVINVTFDRTNAQVNEPITISVTALDVSGIQRVELFSGKEILNITTSPSPARQTALTTQIVWQSPNPGDFRLAARAFNANGNVKETSAQIISILRPGQATPTPVSLPTPTRPRASRATPTTRAQPPAPPTAEIQSPLDHFVGMSPLRIGFAGRGSAELERIELWGFYQGQPNPQIICSIDSHATTQKNGQCDWTAPSAGLLNLFAQAIDIYHQVGRSTPISGYVGVPTLPTPTPTPPSLSSRWVATTTLGSMTATIRQEGSNTRGDFKIAGVDADGRIISGTLKGDRLSFHVEFITSTISTETPISGATLTPNTPQSALDFDCVVDSAVSSLSCSFRDMRGRTGSAPFRRENTP